VKIAYPFGTPETQSPILGCRGKPEKVFPLLKELGYSGIELFVRNPKDFDASILTRQILQFGLEVVAVGTGPVVSDDGLTFSSGNARVRRDALERGKQIIEFASRFGCQVNVGKMRGDIDPAKPEHSWTWIRGGFLRMCEHAEKYHIPVTLEPQNRMVINNLNRTREALTFIREINLPNLMLMLDVYHMNLEDPSIAAAFIEARDLLHHVHFADSNRRAPGRGNLNFLEIGRVLKALNYSKWITVEINQASDSYREAKFAADYLNWIASKATEK